MAAGIHSLIPGSEDVTAIEPAEVVVPAGAGEHHQRIPVGAIRANAHQPRTVFDDESLQGLAASIASVGVLQPILVRRSGDLYELIAGERRWRASQLAGLETIPAMVRDVDDERSLQEALVENVQRQDLNAIEEAFAFQELMEDFQLSQNDIATRIGKSRASIANTIRLLQLPGALRQLISEGELSAGHGRALLMIDDAAEQVRIAGECIKSSWSVRQLEAVVRNHDKSTLKRNGPKPRSGPRAKGRDPRPDQLSSTAALEVETQLSEVLNTSVEVVEKGGRRQLIIEYADPADLSRIMSIVMEGHSPDPSAAAED